MRCWFIYGCNVALIIMVCLLAKALQRASRFNRALQARVIELMIEGRD